MSGQRRRAGLLVGLLLVLPVAGAIADPLGAELYGDYCANCHGDNASNVPAYPDNLAEFTERLEGVTENMPDFSGFFDEDEIAALYAYLNSMAD
jgi:mono/diheme cytochrome c family protein